MSYNNLAAIASLEIVKQLAAEWQEAYPMTWTRRSSNVLEISRKHNQSCLYGVMKNNGLTIWSWDADVAALEWMQERRAGRPAGLAGLGSGAFEEVKQELLNGSFPDGLEFYGGIDASVEFWYDLGFGCDDKWVFLGNDERSVNLAQEVPTRLWEVRTGEFATSLCGGLRWGACNNINGPY